MVKLLTSFILTICIVTAINGLKHPVFFIEGDGWQNQTHGGYIGHFKIPITVQLNGWWIALVYDQPILEIEAWQGVNFMTSSDKRIRYLKQITWNKRQYPGMVMDQRFLIGFEKLPGVNYDEYYGPRPAIVFLDKVYIPDPFDNNEHEMNVYKIDQYNLPSNFEMLPVTIVTPAPTSSPASTTPFTPGPNPRRFWWVRTVSPPRTTTTRATTTATTTSSGPTTTTPRIYTVSCERSVASRKRRCLRRRRPLKKCFIPQCSSVDNNLFRVVQCWKYLGSCWCVNPHTGVRPKGRKLIVRYKNANRLNCFSEGEASTTTATASTTTRATLPTRPPNAAPLSKPLFVPRSDYDYNLVIHNSLLFFEAQRSGNIGTNGRVFWRRSAHLDDGGDCFRPRGSLSGGYYVSGGYTKFGFPTAAAMTMLAWGFLEFQDAYEAAWQTQFLKQALKWGADYFIRAHISPNQLVGQIGDPTVENRQWERPQDMTAPRPCHSITETNPGSDLAGETAAALAATAKVWLMTGSDRSDPYVQTLLTHARQLYSFAVNYKGTYSFSIRQAMDHFPSTSYYDELVWAALWLYEATGSYRYLSNAQNFYQTYNLDAPQGELSWDSKTVAAQLLLAKYAHRTGNVNDGQRYLTRVTEFCDHNRPGGSAQYTPRGLLFMNEWGTTRYACNAAFLCLVASKLPAVDKNLKVTYRQFAESQADYVLGKTGRSYVIGYGDTFPRNPHHRASSCSMSGPCGWDAYHSNEANPQILSGALVGGPGNLDQYTDNRTMNTYNGVGIDYNAGMQGLVAGLRHFQIEYNNWIKYTKRTGNTAV